MEDLLEERVRSGKMVILIYYLVGIDWVCVIGRFMDIKSFYFGKCLGWKMEDVVLGIFYIFYKYEIIRLYGKVKGVLVVNFRMLC